MRTCNKRTLVLLITTVFIASQTLIHPLRADESCTQELGQLFVEENSPLIVELNFATRGFSSNSNPDIQNFLKKLLETRINEMMRFVERKAGEPTEYIYPFSMFAFWAKNITQLPEFSGITMPDLLELTLDFIRLELNQRLQNLIMRIKSAGEIFRNHRKQYCATSHTWPCNCQASICKDGMKDLSNYQDHLDKIEATMIRFMVSIEAATRCFVEAEKIASTQADKDHAAHAFSALASVGKFFSEIDTAISTCQIRP